MGRAGAWRDGWRGPPRCRGDTSRRACRAYPSVAGHDSDAVRRRAWFDGAAQPETPTCPACLEIFEAQRRHPEEMLRSFGLALAIGRRDPALERRCLAARLGREMGERVRAQAERYRPRRRSEAAAGRRGMKKGRAPGQ